MNLMKNMTETAMSDAGNRSDVTPDNIERPNVPPRLNAQSFPHPPPTPGSMLPTTIENVEHLLRSHGISARYDVIRKEVQLCDKHGQPVSMNAIISTASLQGLKTGLVYNFVDDLAERNAYNPAAEWIRSKAWDGQDRFQRFLNTVTAAPEYPPDLKVQLIYRWMLSVVAAALRRKGFHARGVLTLQGGQGIGKTSWIAALVDDPELRASIVKLDHHLDAGNKDSIIGAVKNWIVEIGELDGSFRRDVARLKGLLTSDCDKLRRPYARGISEYPRRTVFAATVNDYHFLVDSTGNSRWWVIEVEKLDFHHDIDMQQLFAQLAVDYDEGEQWWLTPKEEEQLNSYNQKHRAVSAIAERILDVVDLDRKGDPGVKAVTAIQVLRHIGVASPSNVQCKECGTVLREYLGPPKRIQGRDRWRVPLREVEITSVSEVF